MAPLPRGPYVVKFEYQTTIGTQVIGHDLELTCAAIGAPPVGSAATTVQLATRSGGTIALSQAVNDVWSFLRLGASTVTICTSVTLWRVDGVGVGDVFISTAALTVGSTGTVATAPSAGSQITLTYRTGLGRVLKVPFMETSSTAKTQNLLVSNVAGLWFERLTAYMLSSSGWIAGRGGTWPVAPMKVSYTYNEALEKRRFRPNV